MSTILVKPVGDRCNLSCTHCFYHPELGGRCAVMEEATLAAMTRGFLAEGESPTIFAWQGGEPTLAGIAFYRRALALQERFARRGQTVVNAFQTNGVLLDREWAEFFAEHRVLVGLSIDGPPDCHDPLRRTAEGGGSHAAAAAAWRALRRAGCAVNILCVVHAANRDHPERVYAHLTRELGAEYLQFIPCVEWAPEGGVEPYSLRPGEYGRFLAALFELWAAETERSVSVKLFDDLVLRLAGKPMRDCMHRDSCDSHLVVEADGSVYPCDFFVTPDHRLGDINESAPEELRATPQARAFREQKSIERPGRCTECEHLDLCQGGCRKFQRPGGAGEAEQYLCEDMLYFLTRCRPRLEQMAETIRRRWRQWDAAGGVRARTRPAQERKRRAR